MSSLSPFIKWGSFHSQDQNSPDTLYLKVRSVEPFETSYSINVEVLYKIGNEWKEMVLPLKYHDSKNASLLYQWKKAVNEAKITNKTNLLLKTWLAESRNGRTIRRFFIEF